MHFRRKCRVCGWTREESNLPYPSAPRAGSGGSLSQVVGDFDLLDVQVIRGPGGLRPQPGGLQERLRVARGGRGPQAAANRSASRGEEDGECELRNRHAEIVAYRSACCQAQVSVGNWRASPGQAGGI